MATVIPTVETRPDWAVPATPATSPTAVARALAVTVGPQLLLDLFVGASLVAAATGALTRPSRTPLMRLMRPMLALGVAAPAVYLLAVRPWHLRWGATAEEASKPLPGGASVSCSAFQSTRAVTIHAPIETVWPWLAQIGQDRGGFYSYEWLENLAGCRMRNADRVHPEWQQRAIGEKVSLHPAFGLNVKLFEPNRALALEGWGTFVLEPIDERTTRLIVRGQAPAGWSAITTALLWEIPHFIMERSMLLGIKKRAECFGRFRTSASQ